MKKADLKTVLVPVDFSKLSRPAIDLAKDIAQRYRASIHLVHVHEFLYSAGPLAPVPMPLESYNEEIAVHRNRRLRTVAKRNGLAPENCHLRTGSPIFREVCNLAREIAADLIVMPTHGYTGVARLFSGSIAERIVQHSPCPVLVARQGGKTWRRKSGIGKTGIDSIVVPVDFSQPSFQALECAIDFAEQVAGRLILLHAVPLADAFTADGFGLYDLSVLQDSLRRDAEDQMQRFVRLAKFRRVPYETVVRVGSAISEICGVAEARDADLIITATHGRTGFKHLLMGSVAEQVVRQSLRPVLVVPTHPEARTATLTSITQPRVSRPIQAATMRPTPPVGKRLTKRGRKLETHAFPERRKTNRFRESHSARS